MKKHHSRQAERRKPTRKPGTQKMSKKTKFPPPEQLAAPESVFVVGAIVDSVYVLRDEKRVEVMAACNDDKVLDARGDERLTWYRFHLPKKHSIVAEFMAGSLPKEEGEYHNGGFISPMVIEGVRWGTDANPDDLTNPIVVLRDATLKHLAHAMGEVNMRDESARRVKTLVPIPSKMKVGHEFPAGSEAVVVESMSEDGSVLLIEIQASEIQECVECMSDEIEDLDESPGTVSEPLASGQ